jgi:uncharacterized protein (DUF302 family)
MSRPNLRQWFVTCALRTVVLLLATTSVAAQSPNALAPFPMMPFAPATATGSGPSATQQNPWMAWMMSMMGNALASANPYVYGQWMAAMTSPVVDQATRIKVMEAMMEAFDPEQMLLAGRNAGFPKVVIPGFPTQSKRDVAPNTVGDKISTSAKRKAYQTMMMMSPLSMRDMISIMADKMLVAEDVSFEDAVDAMKLRANEINFKLVAHNPLWLDVRAISGDQDTPRIEIFQFCDAMVARKVLDHVPEFAVFLPCRIALLEDAKKQLWVMTLDWDVGWMDFAQNPNNNVGDELRASAKRIRDGIRYIMQGAASGDF